MRIEKIQAEDIRFLGFHCTVRLRAYPNGRPAIQLFDYGTGEPIATATVYVPELPLAPR